MTAAAPKPQPVVAQPFDCLVILDAVIKKAGKNTERQNKELEKAFKRGTGILGASAHAEQALMFERGLQHTRVSFDRLMAAVRDELLAGRYEVSDLERAVLRDKLAQAFLAAGGKL